jgi:hypothetical protein
VPIALVLKRISKVEITDDGLQVINVLPRRITPLESEMSIWQSVNRYWDNPIGNRRPVEGENPTSFELGILDGILTEDMKEVWRAELRAKSQQEKEDKELFDTEWVEARKYAIELAKDNPMPVKSMVVDTIYDTFTERYNQFSKDDVAVMIGG